MSSRTRYLAFRTIQTVFMLWLVLTFLFFFFRMMPGSYADIMMYRGASPETIEQFEQQWGLNQPLYVQYWKYLESLASGSAGRSLQFREPVLDYIQMKIFNSFILVAPGITVAYIIGSFIGGVFGNKRGSALEQYGLLPIIAVSAVPEFFMGIMLIIVFAGWLNMFPTSGMLGATARFADAAWWRPYLSMTFARHYVLPFTAILFRYIYFPSLIMRTSVVEVMNQDFFYYHRITGLPYFNKLAHLIKNASLPVITLYPVSMTRAIGGLVVLEIVFNWPGIGFALVRGVLSRDFPVVQFVFFLVAAWVIIANFAVDIIYGIIDPRVSIEEGTD